MTVRQLFGIDVPIIQAPMAGVQASALAIAVSNAGAGGHARGRLVRGVEAAAWRRRQLAGIVLLTLAYGAYLAPEWDPVRDDQQEYLALARGIVATG